MAMSAELIAAANTIDRMFEAQGGGGRESDPGFYAPTGEPHITFTSGGRKEQGAPNPVWFSTPDAALAAWLQAVTKYASASPATSTVWWRMRPAIRDERLTASDDSVFTVYSRLLISAMPVLPRDHILRIAMFEGDNAEHWKATLA